MSIPVCVYLERKLRDNIRHAKLVCHGFEDTKECRIAWSRVDDIQTAIHKKRDRDRANALDRGGDRGGDRANALDRSGPLDKVGLPFDSDDDIASREYDA